MTLQHGYVFTHLLSMSEIAESVQPLGTIFIINLRNLLLVNMTGSIIYEKYSKVLIIN